MAVEIQWKGVVSLTTALGEIAREMPNEVATALYREAQLEMTEAKRRTPVDTGALRSSGHVKKPVIAPGLISVTMGFGGPARGGLSLAEEASQLAGQTSARAERFLKTGRLGRARKPRQRPTTVGYALIVHEDLNAIHRVGQAKYLESVVVESANEMAKRVMEGVSRILKRRSKKAA